jgi:hypothetical protein
MTPTLRSLRYLLLLTVPFAALPARAVSAACQPVMASMLRVVQTPNHQFMTNTVPGRAPMKSETVTNGKTLSVLVAGDHWKTMPYDAQAELTEMKRKFADPNVASKMSCTRVRAEAVGGEAATLYATHESTGAGGAVDVQVWVSDARGLPLRQVITMPELKSHAEVSFDYANVQAPAAH